MWSSLSPRELPFLALSDHPSWVVELIGGHYQFRLKRKPSYCTQTVLLPVVRGKILRLSATYELANQ